MSCFDFMLNNNKLLSLMKKISIFLTILNDLLLFCCLFAVVHNHYLIRLSPDFPVPGQFPWKKINKKYAIFFKA